MIRLVRTPNGVQIDPTGKISGRGAYLHNKYSCWEKGMKGSLARALRSELSDQDRAKLIEYKNTLQIQDQ